MCICCCAFADIGYWFFSQKSEINLSVIGPYVDYLTEKQGVKSIFGKNDFFFFLT